MSWTVTLSRDAQKDYDRLDKTQQTLVLKSLDKLAQNPLPVYQGGYGKPLGNKRTLKLAGYYKVKIRKAGIRIVYELRCVKENVFVIVIGMRDSDTVYRTALERIQKR